MRFQRKKRNQAVKKQKEDVSQYMLATRSKNNFSNAIFQGTGMAQYSFFLS